MTFSEYKAWFEGFTEAFDGKVPTKSQWKRIQERMAEVTPDPVRWCHDRYWRPWWPTYYSYTITNGGKQQLLGNSTAGQSMSISWDQNNQEENLTLLAYDVGKQEAAEFIS